IDVRLVNMATFTLGSALAGAGGALLAPVAGVVPNMGSAYIARAFMTVVVGGPGVLTGTSAASGVLGSIEYGVSYATTPFFGGYAYGAASINLIVHTGETLSAVAIAALIAAAASALLGYFIFYGNLGDVYVAIVTLATTLVLFTFFSSTASPSYHIGSALLGGYNGMVAIPAIGYRG